MPTRLRIPIPALAALALVCLTLPADAAVDRVKKIAAVELEVRALPEPDPPSRRWTLQADRPSRLRFSVDWEEVGPVRVELTGRAEPSGADGARRLRLRAVLALPDGRQVRASREAVVKDRTTLLFELFRQDERPFTLAITAELTESWEVVNTVTVGPPVRFEVEVFRVDGNTQTSLERNQLHTFVSQQVRYEFKLGPEPTDEALTLSLTPVRLVGDLVEVKVNVEGRLPGEDGVTVLARDDNLIVNRGATSSVDATAGEPTTGYRFQVKALF